MSAPICIIPARGGSKRFTRKNLALLAGIPLIEHTINAAKESNVFADIYLSSEDDEILQAAEHTGVHILKRPEHLAGDTITMAQIFLFVLEELKKEGKLGDAFALMQTTSPLRDAEDVRAAYEIFKNTKGDAVLSAIPCPHPPQRALGIVDGFLKPFLQTQSVERNTQDLEKLYMCNGAISFLKTEAFFREKTFFVQKAEPYIMSAEHGVDIDEPIQLEWAEFLLSRR